MLNFKIYFSNNNIIFKGYCIIDWAKDSTYYRSITKYVFSINNEVIFKNNKHQITIVLFTMEVKYDAWRRSCDWVNYWIILDV